MKRVFNFRHCYVILVCMIFILAAGCKKTADEPKTVIDIDGNVYKIVTIGTQTWFVENLKTTKLNDGTLMPDVTDKAEWDDLSTEAYCWYDDDAATYKESYGALYNWFAVATGKLCPTGWHVASFNEWTTLIDYVGGTDVAGGKLKEVGTSHWNSPNEGATDEYGFKARAGGYRYPVGITNNYWIIGRSCYIWTSTEETVYNSYAWEMTYDDTDIYENEENKNAGLSVRCIKD
jgi:uncharacterized protein (TIGR02145 family)